MRVEIVLADNAFVSRDARVRAKRAQEIELDFCEGEKFVPQLVRELWVAGGQHGKEVGFYFLDVSLRRVGPVVAWRVVLDVDA